MKLQVTILAGTISVLASSLAAAPDGAAIYKSKCAACHGPDGSGQTAVGKSMKLRDLRSADVQKQTDEALVTVITSGRGKMPGYQKKLSSDEIKGAVAFVRALGKR